MTTPAKWARGDRAVVYAEVVRVSKRDVWVKFACGKYMKLAVCDLMMLSPNDPNHSASER